MCSKVLNGHIILTDTSITTILAPEMTYTPKNMRVEVVILIHSNLWLVVPNIQKIKDKLGKGAYN